MARNVLGKSIVSDRESDWSPARLSATRPVLGVSWLDVKLGVRMLGKEPLLTAVAILTLAVGIPASLSPFHVLGVFDSTFPVEEGDRIFGIRNWDIEENQPVMRALHDFSVWREELTSFQAIGVARSDPWNVHSLDGRAAEVRGAEVSASVFRMLRVRPIMGRMLLDSDEVEGAPDVVVLGEDVWASRFARDPEIVGKTIGIGRRLHTVVGVMPQGFLFPMLDHLWLPLRADPADYVVGTGPDLYVFGRLADGVSREEAGVELELVGQRLAAEWPETHERLRPEVVPIALMAFGEPASGLAESREVLLIEVFCLVLLFVACGNVGTMILARTAARVSEITVRTALGASRARIITQLFVESFVLALTATGIGLVLANEVVRRLAEWLIDELPYWFDISIGLRSVLMALALSAVCAVIAGVLPAIKATSPRVQQSLQRMSGGATVRFGAFATLLVVAEVALSVGFLSMGVVALTSFMSDGREEAEIDIDRYLTARYRTVWVDPTADEADTHEEEFWTRVATNQLELKRILQAEPEVRAVAMGLMLPGASHPARWVEVEGDASGDGAGRARVSMAQVDVDFFRDLDHPVLEGRNFGTGDLPAERGAHRPAVIVNTSFVDQVFGGGGALGQRIRYVVGQDQPPGEWYEVVGVVGGLAMNVQNPEKDAGVYHPRGPGEIFPMRYILEVGEDPASFIPRLRTVASAIDPDAMIQLPRTLAEVAQTDRLEDLLASILIMTLSVVGTILAAAGLYALMSFTVSQRTREIGIRTALGARPASVVGTVARQAALQLIAGVALGSVFGGWLLYDMSDSMDIASVNIPLVLFGVALAVIAMVAIACLSPVLHGLRIQPTEALRER